MKIYIKTPWINDNKYIPHMLEHCVLSSDNIDEFINITTPCYAATATGYTEFEIDNNDQELLLKKLATPITKKNFEKEKKIIKDELKGASFCQKSYINMYKKISGNKNLVSNHIQEGVEFEDVLNYQKKYYKPENMVLVDDNNELISNEGIKNKFKFDPKIELKSNIEYKITKYQGEESINIYTKYETPYDILLLDFLYELLYDYTYYLKTIKGKYWREGSDISLSNEYMILSFKKGYLPKRIDEKFFDGYKKYTIKEIEKGKYRIYIPIITLFTGVYITKQQHAKFIENIEIKKINQILKISEIKSLNKKDSKYKIINGKWYLKRKTAGHMIYT